MRIFFLFLTCVLFFAGCATRPNSNNAGEELYANKCSGCHRLHKRNEFDSTSWKSIMSKMSIKSKISHKEEKIILNYLINAEEKTK